jgi:hypothetical protein
MSAKEREAESLAVAEQIPGSTSMLSLTCHMRHPLTLPIFIQISTKPDSCFTSDRHLLSCWP